MSKIRFFQKQQRLLRFLRGSRTPETAARLAARGFSPAERARGEALLVEAIRARAALPARLVQPRGADDALARCAALERAWVPLAQATLEARAPALAARVFDGLGRTTGLEVLVGLAAFAARLRALRDGDAEEQATAAVLEARGLGAATLDEIEQAVAEARAEPPAVPGPALPDQAAEAAEREAWAFYKEWSRIARTVVREPALLRAMGFRGARARAGEEVPEGPTA